MSASLAGSQTLPISYLRLPSPVIGQPLQAQGDVHFKGYVKESINEYV